MLSCQCLSVGRIHRNSSVCLKSSLFLYIASPYGGAVFLPIMREAFVFMQILGRVYGVGERTQNFIWSCKRPKDNFVFRSFFKKISGGKVRCIRIKKGIVSPQL